MKKRAMLFDFDGTLIDSLGDAAASFHFALAQIGQPPIPLSEIKKYFGMGADRIFLNLLKDKDISQRAFEHYKDHQRESAKDMVLHRGVAEMLAQFAEAKIPTAIVTGRHIDDLEIAIERHKISDQFSALICDNHLKKSKPDPEGLKLALSKLNISAENAVYVGDSVFDIQAAQGAGMTSIAALWDANAAHKDFSTANPDYFANRPSEIWDIFKRA